MAYNHGPPPGAYPPRQHSTPFTGAAGPPGIGMPPGMDAAPGVQSQSPTTMQNPTFQPPPNMPNINFNAPVIRLGLQDQPPSRGGMSGAMDRLAGGGREGRGSNAESLGRGNRTASGPGEGRNIERERAAVRENMMATHPPTREEVARTIFIGGLGEGAPNDEALESILRCAGKLRRWTRARDADDKPCKFGFAEYEDVDSLEAANEILPGLEIPLMSPWGAALQDEDGEIKKMPLLVVVDEQSKSYIDEWKGKGREDDDARQFRIDGCKDDLRQSLAVLATPEVLSSNGVDGVRSTNPASGDVAMADADGEQAGNTAVVNIPLTLEDELADIPAEMRATVAEEIRAFRERSNRRDMERQRIEEDFEQAERMRNAPFINRLASPPPSGAPSGPASAANNIPVGPRDKGGVAGAPSGPKGYRGVQMPSDYVNGVTFVGTNGDVNGLFEDEDASESDEELERRRQAKRDAAAEEQYQKEKRHWLDRENKRRDAQKRQRNAEANRKKDDERAHEASLRFLREFDDDEAAQQKEQDYYRDRSVWVRLRTRFREAEEHEDELDRQAERREKAEERRRQAEARGIADDFLEQTGLELEQRAAEQAASANAAASSGLKISLGAAARSKAAGSGAAPVQRRRPIAADVERLLDEDDEVDAALTGGVRERPELKPLTDTSTAPLAGDTGSSELTEEERATARQTLAATIPTSAADLFAYPVRWNYLTPLLASTQIRPFVERKVVEYLGVQEDVLVDAVLDGFLAHKEAKEIVADVEGALDDDAEDLVRKCWRVLVFATDSEARGLN